MSAQEAVVVPGPWGRTPVDAWRVLRQRIGWADVAHWTYGGRLDDELGGLAVFRTPCGLYRPGEDWSQPSHFSTSCPRRCERCEAALRHPSGQEGPVADLGWWELVVGWLACWRITRLVTADTLLEDYRAWADNLTAAHSSGWAGRLAWAHASIVTCPWCLSVYVAAAVLAGYLLLPRPLWVAGALVCGWSALTGAAESWVHRG